MTDNVHPLPDALRRAKKEPSFQRTELDMADLLVKKYGDRIRYCGPLGGWFWWNGMCWEIDESERVRECVKRLAKALAHEAVELMDRDKFREARRAGSAAGVRAILELARSSPGVVFSASDANADPWLLNVQNGTIDLRTGGLRAHDRNDLITRCCPAKYDPDAVAPMFEKFLSDVQPRSEVRDYLARFFGYSAVGVVREHVLGVLWGSGSNGKSVLVEVAMHALGGYAKAGPRSLIVHDGKHEPHPTDIASCAGSRLVTVHETRKGASFDASKIKLLTGGDRLTARHMRQDFFEFAPTHTLVMLSNYKPRADATDSALWRRVQLVPFDVIVPDDKQDRELAEKINRDEAPGVLRWIVDGATQWQAIGLAPPKVVLDQTAAYKAAEDVIGRFIEERCVRLKEAQVKAGNLYAAFKDWCQSQGEHAVRGNDFFAEIVARGFEKKVTMTGKIYQGLGLQAVEPEGDDA